MSASFVPLALSRRISTFISTGFALILCGCGAVISRIPATTPTSQSLVGGVHGGQQSVIGAHIYLYAAGTSGYGGPSSSLLNPAYPGVTTDSTGSYVTTDSNGNFSLGGAYGCTPGQQIYIYARGGNPGLPSGANNPALTLISVLGTCPDSGTLADNVPVVNINEVSTVAAVYALAGFMTDPLHVSAPANALAQQGLANAFLVPVNLVNTASGGALLNSVTGNGMSPQETVNTLANVLTSCINSTGISMACSTLFSNAKDSSGNIPTDTVTATLNIAHNPGANVTALFNLAVPTAPFQPSLTSAPNDWTLAITFYMETMVGPYYPAVDSFGDIWIPGYANNTLTELDPLGIPLSGFNAFYGNGLNQPFAVAIDSSQSAWVANYAYGTSSVVSRFSTAGTATGSFACGTNCTAVAFDTLQNAWIASNSGTTTMHNSGVAISKFNTTSTATGLAIDSTGHGWSMGPGRNLYRLTLPTTVNQYSETISSTAANDLNMFAIDSSDNVWFTSGKSNAIGRVDSNGNVTSPGTGFTGGGLKYPAQLAIDGSNRIWVANRDGNSVSAFTHDGDAITPSTGYRPSGQIPPDADLNGLSGLSSPHGIAIDGSGNVWVTNLTANSVTEIIGLATPAVTPISPTTHGQRP